MYIESYIRMYVSPTCKYTHTHTHIAYSRVKAKSTSSWACMAYKLMPGENGGGLINHQASSLQNPLLLMKSHLFSLLCSAPLLYLCSTLLCVLALRSCSAFLLFTVPFCSPSSSVMRRAGYMRKRVWATPARAFSSGGISKPAPRW